MKGIVDRYFQVLNVISQFVFSYYATNMIVTYYNLWWPYHTKFLCVQLDELDQLDKDFWKKISSNSILLLWRVREKLYWSGALCSVP